MKDDLSNRLAGPRWLWQWALFFAMVGSYAAVIQLQGLTLWETNPDALLPIHTGFWAAIVTAAITCFGFRPSRHGGNPVRDTLSSLPSGDAVNMAPALADVARAKQQDPKFVRWSRRMFIGGMVSGVLFAVFGIGMTIDVDRPEERVGHALWYACVLPFVFGSLGRSYYQALMMNRAIIDYAATNVAIDLFDPARLAPFAQLALRQALQWAVFLAAMSAITAAPEISVLSMTPLLLGGLFITVLSFVMPLQSIHRRLVAEKQAAIETALAAIHTSRCALDGGNDAAAARLSAELAWHKAISDAHEWPLDMGTLARFVIYLGIPIAGWLASAVAEQVLDTII